MKIFPKVDDLKKTLKKKQTELETKTNRLVVVREKIEEARKGLKEIEIRTGNDVAYLEQIRISSVVPLTSYKELTKVIELAEMSIARQKNELERRLIEKKMIEDTQKKLNEEIDEINKQIQSYGSVVSLKKNEKQPRKPKRKT